MSIAIANMESYQKVIKFKQKYPVAHWPPDIFHFLIMGGPPLGVFAGVVGTGVVGI